VHQASHLVVLVLDCAAPAYWVSVTVDSPEKQRGGIIGLCHGAADQG
jgi:hypothetical protein